MLPSSTFVNPHDVIIIGAGPAGLATAARLRENTPSALFTDEEHRRYHWILKHGNHATIIDSKTGRKQGRDLHTTKPCTDILVLDSSSTEWMTNWNQLFERFHISHLRSPMFFHLDPNDRDGMLAFTHEQGREKELVEIPGCVGKEISKHKQKKRRNKSETMTNKHCPCVTKLPTEIDERDRKDYLTPSTSLFCDYCEAIVDRYDLRSGMIRHEPVVDIDFGDFVPEEDKLFKLVTDQGVHYTRAVVLAVGAGGVPRLPTPLLARTRRAGACHAFDIKAFPDPQVQLKMEAGQSTNIVVVGGGLTSAQISDLAVRHGISKVWHIMRGPLKVKPFDVDLNWVGKYKNQEKAAFWSADTDEERLELIKQARGGGSMTSRYHKLLKQHAASGRLSLHTNTIISSQSYCEKSKTWHILTEPPIAELPEIDYIYYATGAQSGCEEMPCLKTMLTKYPIETHAGLPALTDDLMWSPEIPLFVTGRLAALRLGPGAGNLEGARMGAERVAWALEDIFGKRKGCDSDNSDVEEDDMGNAYHAGVGSRFASLADE